MLHMQLVAIRPPKLSKPMGIMSASLFRALCSLMRPDTSPSLGTYTTRKAGRFARPLLKKSADTLLRVNSHKSEPLTVPLPKRLTSRRRARPLPNTTVSLL
jgi:hypothetical protein